MAGPLWALLYTVLAVAPEWIARRGFDMPAYVVLTVTSALMHLAVGGMVAVMAIVKAFLTRPIEGEHPCVWLDATFHKVRELGRVVSVATVVAVGVDQDGQRHVLGCDTGPSEDRVFWTRFLRALSSAASRGTRLVISDSHEGLKGAIAKVFPEASWQRCRVHFMRNLLSTVTRSAQEAVAALVRTIFAQPDHASALAHLSEVADMLRRKFPQAADLLEDAAEDLRPPGRRVQSHYPHKRVCDALGFPRSTIYARAGGGHHLKFHGRKSLIILVGDAPLTPAPQSRARIQVARIRRG